MRRTMATAAAGITLLLAGCGSGSDSAAEPEAESPLEDAYDTCYEQMETAMTERFKDDAPDIDQMLVLADEGQSLTVSTPDPGGELMSASAFLAASCVLTETGAPSTIATSMQSATALMGRQSESYDGIDVDWSYAAGMDSAGFLATFVTT